MQNRLRFFRFSLAGLFVAVFFVAFAVAALRFASHWWATATFTLTVGLLAVGLIGAMFRLGERRAFWTGFVLFGGGYLLLVFGPWLADFVGPNLVTNDVAALLHEQSQQTVQQGMTFNTIPYSVPSADFNTAYTQYTQAPTTYPDPNFERPQAPVPANPYSPDSFPATAVPVLDPNEEPPTDAHDSAIPSSPSSEAGDAAEPPASAKNTEPMGVDAADAPPDSPPVASNDPSVPTMVGPDDPNLSALVPPLPAGAAAPLVWPNPYAVSGVVMYSTTGPDLEEYRRITHSLFALLAAFIGGVTAKWFYRTRGDKESPPRPAAPATDN